MNIRAMRVLLLGVSIHLFFNALVACAQSITIQNPGFETANLATGGYQCNILAGSTVYPVAGTLANWSAYSTTNNAAAGAEFFALQYPAWTSKWWSGTAAGYLQIESAGVVWLAQNLPAGLQNNTTYTLSALVARPLDTAPPGQARYNYALQLWAGTTLLGSASNLLNMPVNTSATNSLTYSSGANNPLAGQPLTIILASTGVDGANTIGFFDNITLTASGGSSMTNVLPQLAFGGGWYTALYFTNTTGAPVSFPVNLFDGNGNPLNAPAIGGASSTVNLQPRGTASIKFPNTGPLVQGYVSVAVPSGVTGYGVFRQSVAGVPDQEAVVPLSGVTHTTGTLLFDDTNNIVTGIAAVNLGTATAVNATAYDPNGNLLGSATIPMAPNGKIAAALQSIIPATAGVLGSVDFTVPTGNVAALGLRFNGSAFTSIPTSDR